MCLQLFFILLLLRPIYTTSKCNTFVTSSIELKDCSDRRCDLINRYTFESFINDGSQICLSDDNTDSNLDFPDISISFNDSHIIYDLVDCYNTDDPQISFIAICGCPLGHHYDCRSCPILSNDTINNLCIDGTHAGSNCLLSGSGTFCSQVMFRGSSRYSICKIGKSNILVNVQYFENGYQNMTSIFNNEYTFKFSNSTKLQVSSTSKTGLLTGKYVIRDLVNQDSFLITDHENTNSIVDFDPFKAGWYRDTEFKVDRLRPALNIYPKFCRNNTMTLGVSAARISNLFNKLIYDNTLISPGSVLFLDETPNVWDSYDSSSSPLTALTQGRYFYDASDTPRPFGLLTGDALPYSEMKLIGPINVTTKCGHTYNKFNCGPLFLMWADTDETYSAKVCKAATINCWGICMEYYNSKIGAIEKNCIDPIFPARLYPTKEPVVARFYQSGFLITTPGGLKYDESPPIPTLYTEAVDMKFRFIFESTKRNFKFESSTTVPVITDLDASNDDYLLLYVYSSNNPGNCIATFSSSAIASKEISITEEVKSYKFPYNHITFEGDVLARVECYRNSDEVKFHIKVTRKSDTIDFDVKQTSESRRLTTTNRSSWGWLALTLMPGFWLPMMLYYLFNNTPNITAPFSKSNLYWSIPGIILTLPFVMFLMYLIYKLMCWFKSMFRRNKWNDKVDMNLYKKIK